MATETKTLTEAVRVRVSEEVRAQLEERAALTHRSVGAVIRLAIHAYLASLQTTGSTHAHIEEEAAS